MDDSSVTAYIAGLVEADEEAAQKIWEKYFDKLVRLARSNMRSMQKRETDEEDVALSAMNSFLRGAAEGRFPQLNDREDLWKLLLTCTLRKVSKYRKRQGALKRGKGQVRGESVFAGSGEGDSHRELAAMIASPEPTPEFAAEMSETIEEMLDELHDGTLQRVAVMKLEGYRGREIAEKLGVGEKTIQRKLRRIESKWQRRLETGGDGSQPPVE